MFIQVLVILIVRFGERVAHCQIIVYLRYKIVCHIFCVLYSNSGIPYVLFVTIF